MKFKKLVGAIAAASIAVSAFAGFGGVASATEGVKQKTVLDQNFNTMTAGTANDWTADIGSSAAHGTRSYVADTSDEENIYFEHTVSNNAKATRIARYLLSSDGIALNAAPVTVSFKVMTTNIASDTSASMAGDDFALIGTDGNVILSVAFLDDGIAYYTGGASSIVDNTGTYGVNVNFSNKKYITVGSANKTFNDNTWYDVKVVFNPTDKNVDLTVDGTTVNDIPVETTTALRSLQMSTGRLANVNSAALTSAYPKGCIDDILITQDDVEIKEATVTFTGNATSIVVGTDTVGEDGISLVADTYSYVAKADNYVTEYGTFTVTEADTTTGTKTVNIQLEEVPAAPEKTENDIVKAEENTSIISDGFMNGAGALIDDGLNVQAGDVVVLEYDVYVAGGNDFNVTLKGNRNSPTGANTRFTAGEKTVVVENQNSGNSWTTLGEYTANQWVHVKMSFTAVNPTNTNSPVTDIRTDNVSVTVTPTEGEAFTKTGITARNLASGYPTNESDTKTYSYSGIAVNGTANIANAEMYVVRPSITADFNSSIVTAPETVTEINNGVEGGTVAWNEVVTGEVQTVVIKVTNPTAGEVPTVTATDGTECTPTKTDIVNEGSDGSVYFIYQFAGINVSGATVSYPGAANYTLQ